MHLRDLDRNRPPDPRRPPSARPAQHPTTPPTGVSGVQWLDIGPSAAGQRVDNFLLGALRGVPRSLVYRILRSGEVRVNKGRVKPTYRLVAGDQVRVPPLRLDPEPAAARPSPGLVARLADAVLYEDARLLVLDKPAGVAVHGGSGISLGVIEALRVMRPDAELELVHRLDRDTSGCLVISKRSSALRFLHAQFRDGGIDKRYQALLTGALARPLVEVNAPLRKNLLQGGERMVQVDPAAGKPARTRFRCLRRLALGDLALTLAEAELHTGRTHQIRVHAAHLGAPVAGDEKYGDAAAATALRAVGLKRLFLHACSLCLRPAPEADPIRVEAPLPAALDAVLARLDAGQF